MKWHGNKDADFLIILSIVYPCVEKGILENVNMLTLVLKEIKYLEHILVKKRRIWKNKK